MAEYRFLTSWLLDRPREAVWDAIYDVEDWPRWWRGLESAEPTGGDKGRGVGTTFRLVWRARVPYRLRMDIEVTALARPELMEGTVTGDLRGTGTWRLGERDGRTEVAYEWDVETTRRWMNLLEPLARPAFAWNHDWVMARGGEGLARRLGGRLLDQPAPSVTSS